MYTHVCGHVCFERVNCTEFVNLYIKFARATKV